MIQRLRTKTNKILAWILASISFVAFAAFGAHMYVQHTIEDAIDFIERNYHIEEITYESYSFDAGKQALILNNVALNTPYPSAADSDGQGQNPVPPIKMSIDKIVYEKCDFRSDAPKYCQAGFEGIKLGTEGGNDLVSTMMMDLSRKLDPNGTALPHVVNAYIEHSIDHEGVQDSKVKIILKDRIEFEMAVGISNVDWDAFAKSHRESRQVAKDQTLTEEESKKLIKDTFAILNEAKIHHLSYAVVDQADTLSIVPFGAYEAFFGESQSWSEFVANPKKLKFGLTHAGGIGAANVSSGEYKPEELNISVSLNDVEYEEIQDRLKVLVNQSLTPEFVNQMMSAFEKATAN
jgi:hypothetical protein